MTDEELIARLQNSKGWPTLGNAAADRIEALTEQLAAARRDAEEAEAYAGELEADRKKTYEALLRVTRIYDEVEAKLAKAVEALELIVVDNTWGLEHQTYMKCRKALAEIKGESHE